MPTSPKDIGGGHFRDLPPSWPAGLRHPNQPALSVAAAWVQYLLARRVWDSIASGDTSMTEVAELMGESTENQRKKLSGQSWASVHDLLGWTLAFVDDFSGLKVERLEDLFPDTAVARLAPFRPGQRRLPELTAEAGPNWQGLAQAVCLEVASQAVGGWITVTAEVVSHVVALCSVRAGVASERVVAPGSGRSGAARFELALASAHVCVDSWVLPPSNRRPVDRFREALARTATSATGERTILVVLGPPGSPQPEDLVPIGTLRRPGEQGTIGPLEVPTEVASELATGVADWWSSASVDVRVVGMARNAGAYALAIEILKHRHQ